MNDVFNRFFESLSSRMYKENDLSDITYSLLQSSEKFMEVFVSFITEDPIKQKNGFEVSREYSLDPKNRPDFFFIGQDEVILLENKVWDTNYHFHDYEKALSLHLSSYMQYKPKAPFKALISAHTLSPENIAVANSNGFKVIYWSEFVDLLKLEMSKRNFNAEEIPLVGGYVKYLEEVVKTVEIGKIKLDREALQSIVNLVQLMQRIVLQSVDEYAGSAGFSYKMDKINKQANADGSSGLGYIITKNGGNASAFASFYLQYSYKGNKGNPAILIELPYNWNSDLNKKIPDEVGQTFVFDMMNLKDKEGCAFMLKDSLSEVFYNGDQEAQIGTLKSFYDEVNTVIEKYL